MKIVVAGTRGIPNILGGVETHCEELYPRLAAKGHEIIVLRRSCYVTADNRTPEYKGVKLIDVFAPRVKSIEAIAHTFLAVIKARTLNPDILHIHAIGPSIMVPFARLLGLKVVTTNHGPDYDRAKWGGFAKHILKIGECWGAKYSNRIIAISHVISDILSSKYGRSDADLIYNGVNLPQKSKSTSYLQSLGAVPGNYILAIGRFVKEKGFHDLIDAWASLDMPNKPQLVIAGDSDHEDEYSTSLKRKAMDAGVILTGFIKGEKLNQIMTNARLFVLPSYHEGLPIALLEALSYGLDVAVSDIPANMLPILDSDDFFTTGDVKSLASTIGRKLLSLRQNRIYDLSEYNWDAIADKTEAVYLSLTEKI